MTLAVHYGSLLLPLEQFAEGAEESKAACWLFLLVPCVGHHWVRVFTDFLATCEAHLTALCGGRVVEASLGRQVDAVSSDTRAAGGTSA